MAGQVRGGIAVVTGGASGIGRSIARELVAPAELGSWSPTSTWPGPRTSPGSITRFGGFVMYNPDKLARDVVDGIEGNKIYVIEPLHAKAAWYGMRVVPVAPVLGGAVVTAALKMVRRVSGA